MEVPSDLLPSSANPASAAMAIGMMKYDEYDIPISSWFIIILTALITGVWYYIAVLSWRHFETVKLEKIDKAIRKREKKEKKRKTSTRNKEAAKANETPFIKVEEGDESICLYYEPDGMVESVNEVPHMIPVTRWSYEDLLIHLAASTKPYIGFHNVCTQEHMEHVKTILRSCTHFKDIGFTSISLMNQQIYNLVKKKAIEMDNSNIRVCFQPEFGHNESQLLIKVESNSFRIDCQIIDRKRIGYSRFLDFLKEVSNKNNIVFIELDGPKFKDLFVELGWQYEDYMEENLRYGVASNVRLMNDSNVYGLQYWANVVRSLEDAQNEADSDSGLSDE